MNATLVSMVTGVPAVHDDDIPSWLHPAPGWGRGSSLRQTPRQDSQPRSHVKHIVFYGDLSYKSFRSKPFVIVT